MIKQSGYKRTIGSFGLMMSAISAMIGSGWLFTAMYSAKAAGPAAIIAWVLGGILVLIIAFTYAETATMLPIAGGSARLPQLTHGMFVSLFFGWVTWLNIMTAPSIEVQAVLQYAHNYWPALTFDSTNGTHKLTGLGYLLATILMLGLSIVNIYSVKLVTKFNNLLTSWKFVLPTVTAIVLIVVAFKSKNFTNPMHGGFMPYGWQGVFSALATGGILFAFNGFKQAVELAGEAKNPKKAVPIGLVGSLLITLAIYVFLQIAFVGAIKPEDLVQGWSSLNFVGDAGPLAGLLVTFGVVWLAVLLYVDAMISPLASGLVYTTSAGRTLYAMSANRQLPKFLHTITPFGTPGKAIMVNFVLGMLFFLPFPGWHAMAEFMSSIIAVSYITGPMCCLVLRYQLPNRSRVIRLPFIKVWSFAGVYACTLMAYWTGWQIISKLSICLLVCLVLFFAYRVFSPRAREVVLDWKASAFIWFYFIGLTLLSYMGSPGGGKDILPYGTDFIGMAILTAGSIYLAVRFRVEDSKVEERIELLSKEAETGQATEIPSDTVVFDNLNNSLLDRPRSSGNVERYS